MDEVARLYLRCKFHTQYYVRIHWRVGVAPGCFLPWAPETINKRDLEHPIPETARMT